MNGILDWGDKQVDYATHLLNGNYQRVDSGTVKNEKLKQPEAAITIHTIQPYGKIMRDEESDVPYTEDSDLEVEVSNDNHDDLATISFLFLRDIGISRYNVVLVIKLYYTHNYINTRLANHHAIYCIYNCAYCI
jgi:hypothetical protein